MFRLLCVHVQSIVCSCLDFRAFMFWLPCVHVQTFVRSQDFHAFTSLLCVLQTFVLSYSSFRAFMSSLLCVQQTVVLSLIFHAFMSRFLASTCMLLCVIVLTLVSSPDFRAFRHPEFRAFIRISCVPVQTFLRPCALFRVFMSRLSCLQQKFERSGRDFRAFFDVATLYNIQSMTPPRMFIFRLDIPASV